MSSHVGAERRRSSIFTERELAYLQAEVAPPRLGRIATVGRDGTPHVVPVGWRYNAARDSIDVSGVNLERTKKYRDVKRSGRAALVIDDLASVSPWRPRGIEVRGSAEAVADGKALIRIRPQRIVSWGLESSRLGERHARTVATHAERRERTS